jgi:exopolyphosphatase/guanosine-5'-triphosphate,3'-diphosphate pyrophosphatase
VATKANTVPDRKSGLAYWMERVLAEADQVAQDFAPDPVHDLRVALRRCRSLAEGIQAIDPDPAWKKMRKMGKALFSSLGTLRDCHVLAEWTRKLGAAGDPISAGLLEYCRLQELDLRRHAEQALSEFDRRQWQAWARSLPRRAARLRLGSEPFQSLALERWTQARRLEGPALKTGRAEAFHRLRIGLKKFRYVVENFLPEQHQLWSGGLKRVQDALGEIHDLDVLLETVERVGVLNSPEAQERWRQRIAAERDARIEQYSREMKGKDGASLWQVWRQGLPRGAEARSAAFKKIRSWASFLDPDVRHSRLVARLALQLYDGLARIGVLGENPGHQRELLQAAAVVHEVGRSTGKKGHHKTTRQLVQDLERPFPWSRQDLAVVAFVARYHRGSLPGRAQPGFRSLPSPVRPLAQRLAGILRLANALDADHEGTIQRINVAKPGDFLIIHADGFDGHSDLAERIAGARYLLELSLRIPITVRPLRKWKKQP